MLKQCVHLGTAVRQAQSPGRVCAGVVAEFGDKESLALEETGDIGLAWLD